MAGYGTDAAFEDWLDANGYSLPDDAPSPAILRQRGSSYIDAVYAARFAGYPTGGATQERAWPRTGAYLYGSSLDPAAVPLAVEHAAYAAAYQEAQSPGYLLVSVTPGAQVKREKVGALEVEYRDGGEGSALGLATPLLLTVEGLLAPFLAVLDVAVFVV